MIIRRAYDSRKIDSRRAEIQSLATNTRFSIGVNACVLFSQLPRDRAMRMPMLRSMQHSEIRLDFSCA